VSDAAPDRGDPRSAGAADDGGWPVDEYDTPAEVDATFRTQRGIALGYFFVFLFGTIAVPVLTVVLDWWSTGALIGTMSPNFVMAAFGLYIFFFVLGLAACTLANSVEDRMLGRSSWQGLDRASDAGNDGEPVEG
jgi:hypothetical protein